MLKKFLSISFFLVFIFSFPILSQSYYKEALNREEFEVLNVISSQKSKIIEKDLPAVSGTFGKKFQNIRAKRDFSQKINGKKKVLAVHIPYSLPKAECVLHAVSKGKKRERQNTVERLQESMWNADLYRYSVREGRLFPQLSEWCQKAGYILHWEMASDYELTNKQRYSHDFLESFAEVLQGLRRNGHRIAATVYETNREIVVEGE